MARWIGLLLLLAFVPASSVLGLVRPMTDEPVDGGWDVFADVWQANFWGDAVFVVGTIAAGVAVSLVAREIARLHRPTSERVMLAVAAVAVSVLLHWAVYALSWSLTFRPFLDLQADGFSADTFWAWDWDMMYAEPLLGLENAWTFSWCWGWAGLVFTGIAGPLGAWLLGRANAPARTLSRAPA